MLGNVAGDDKFGQVIAQMSTFAEGLNEIRSAVDTGVQQLVSKPKGEQAELEAERQQVTLEHIGRAVNELANFNASLAEIKTLLDEQMDHSAKLAAEQTATQSETLKAAVELMAEQNKSDAERKPMRIQVVNRVPHTFLDVMRNQFRVMQTWMEPILQLCEALPEAKGLRKAAKATQKNYQEIIGKIEDSTEQKIHDIIDAEIIDDE